MDKSIKKIKKGVQYVDVVSSITKNELTSTNDVDDNYRSKSMVKFIPASGAATRMFKNLYTYLEEPADTEYIDYFFNHLEKFAFYNELSSQINMNSLDTSRKEDRVYIIENLLNGQMDYGKLPKALIKFHKQGDQVTTPIDEHIIEGVNYLDPNNINLHFTIAKEDEERFNHYIEDAIEGKDHIKITYSFQKEKTDTMAANLDNTPFVLENGEILYRPGGHGALLENLNDLSEDIIFIKNIDNVCHQDRIEDTIDSKKKLVSVGMEAKKQIDQYIKDILSDDFNLDEIEKFIIEKLNITSKTALTKERALYFLNRPLRVCGVVKNEGEPGGGPYIVDNGDYYDLQICEKSEIDMDNEEQVKILNTSEYFNPVDLVCFTKNYKGEKFNLLDYTNEDRYFISEKNYEGEPLKALEHPGLWNGSMHHWNTLFVEVPLTTFNPVKSVNDLLKEGHTSVDKNSNL